MSWIIFGTGIFLGCALGIIIAGVLRDCNERAGWIFRCDSCGKVVRTGGEEA